MKYAPLKLVVLLPIIALTMTACVTTSYRVDTTTYTNRDEAWAAVLRRDAETEAGIAAGSESLVQRKLLFVVPTSAAFMRYFEASVALQKQTFPAAGTPAHAQWSFKSDESVQNLKSVAGSIKKSNIYRDVVIFDANSTAENIQPTDEQDVLIPTSVPGGGGGVMYFLSVKHGKQILEIDLAQKERLERRKSILNSLKAKALQ